MALIAQRTSTHVFIEQSIGTGVHTIQIQFDTMRICMEDSIVTNTVFAEVSADQNLNSLVGCAIIRNNSLVIVDAPLSKLVYFGGSWQT